MGNKVVFEVPMVTYGNKTVVASYTGNDKYAFNSTTANFTVNKRQSQVNVTVDAGLVGDDVVINVTIPANATGYVIVSVDGTNYEITIETAKFIKQNKIIYNTIRRKNYYELYKTCKFIKINNGILSIVESSHHRFLISIAILFINSLFRFPLRLVLPERKKWSQQIGAQKIHRRF